MIAESVLNKVGALTINPILRLTLGQKRNALTFRHIMDEGKVLVCNLGRVDGETRRLLGSLIVTGLKQAAASRTDMPPDARRPYNLVMDEFQDYVAQEGAEQTLSQILSECRKFGLHLVMAHQHRGQLGDNLQGVLENAQVARHELLSARHMAEHLANLVLGKHGGQPSWPLGAHSMDGQVHVLPQHLAVEEEERAEGLVLRGGGDPLLHSQMRQKGIHFLGAHLAGVALAVEHDEALDPVGVALTRTGRIVLALDGFPHLVKQSLGSRVHGAPHWLHCRA